MAEGIKKQFLRLTLIVSLQLTLFSALHGAKWTYDGSNSATTTFHKSVADFFWHHNLYGEGFLEPWTEGQDHWSERYPYCGGALQSPIDIETDLLRFDPTLRPIEVQNYNLSPNEQITLGNNGHSVQLSLPPKMYISSLPNHFTAAQLHLHWGSPSWPAGSEHTVNSKRYAAELHVVHYNSDKYPNISMAVDKSDGLAVLGVLIEVGTFNPAFEQFLKFINGVKYRDQKVKVPGFNVRALLPTRLDEYYRYDGSLTTPPCFPSVLWTVFRNPITVSRKQFLTLATALYSSHAQDSTPMSLNNNYRKTQPVDNRLVLVSFKKDELSWINTGLLVPILVSSALGLVFIVTLMCCILRHKRAADERDKGTHVGYNTGDKDEYGSRV